MKEPTEDLLRKGFGIWRKNPDLALPFLFDALLSFLLMVLMAVCFCLLFSVPLTLDVSRLTAWAASYGRPMIIEMLASAFLLFLAYVALGTVISAFFTAGATGMAYKAIEGGWATLDDMRDAAKRRFLPLLFLWIILVFVYALVAVIIIFPAAVVFLSTLVIGFPMWSVIDFMIGALVIACTAMSIIFLMSQFYVVIGGSGAFDSLKKSFGFFKKDKLRVLLMYAFTNAFAGYVAPAAVCAAFVVCSIGLLLTPMPLDMFSSEALSSLIGPLLVNLSLTFIVTVAALVLAAAAISIFIVQPLMTIWLTLLYQSGVKEK